MLRRQLLSCAWGLAAVALSGYAGAQSFPSKTITIYCPYPAGGISDIQARTVAPLLSKALGQTVVVENLTGASGSIAAAKMLSLPADGHTLMVVSPSETILAPITVKGVKYQAEDLRLLANGIAAPTALLIRPTLPVNSIPELIAYTKNKNNKEVSFGSVGPGSMPQLIAEEFKLRTGSSMFHVPYRGGAPMLNDLMAGQIDVAFMPFGGPILGMVAAGKMKVLGISTETRMPGISQYPTFEEAHPSLKGYYQSTWSTFAVAKGTPNAVIAKYNAVLGDIMQSAEIAKWAKAMGTFASPRLDVAEMAAFYKAETTSIRAIAKRLKLEAQ